MNQRFIVYVISIVFGVSLFACNGEKKHSNDLHSNITFTDTLTKNDTLDVLRLSGLCMNTLEHNIDSALNFIYFIQGDTLLVPLPNNKREFLKTTLSKYPIKSYDLLYLKFNSQYDNILKYKIFYSTSNTPNSINLTFNPIKLDDAWYLTLKDN